LELLKSLQNGQNENVAGSVHGCILPSVTPCTKYSRIPHITLNGKILNLETSADVFTVIIIETSM
jgi:hypothetical protein